VKKYGEISIVDAARIGMRSSSFSHQARAVSAVARAAIRM